MITVHVKIMKGHHCKFSGQNTTFTVCVCKECSICLMCSSSLTSRPCCPSCPCPCNGGSSRHEWSKSATPLSTGGPETTKRQLQERQHWECPCHTPSPTPRYVPLVSVHMYIFNPRRACAARLTVLGLSVCLSVDAYSGTTGYEAAYELYKRVQIYEGKRQFSCNGCVREIWRENKQKIQYDNEYSLTAVLLQRPLAWCFDNRGF